VSKFGDLVHVVLAQCLLRSASNLTDDCWKLVTVAVDDGEGRNVTKKMLPANAWAAKVRRQSHPMNREIANVIFEGTGNARGGERLLSIGRLALLCTCLSLRSKCCDRV
jgi:hypothetical protein